MLGTVSDAEDSAVNKTNNKNPWIHRAYVIVWIDSEQRKNVNSRSDADKGYGEKQNNKGDE